MGCACVGTVNPLSDVLAMMQRYWTAHSDRDYYDATHGYDAPEPITPEQEKLLAEEQERDLAEIDAERAREERRRVLEEAAMAALGFDPERALFDPVSIAYMQGRKDAAADIRDLIKETSRD